MKKKVIKTAEDVTFTRSFSFEKDDHRVSLACQPYITGMYVAGSDSMVAGPIQLSITHKGFAAWSKKLVAGLKKDGYTVSTSEAFLKDYLPVDDINAYLADEYGLTIEPSKNPEVL
jgi:hypothetical protein